MSNPGVITLVNENSRKGKFKRFVIEDNIGESIHLHIDNIRIDFTIKEFLDFSSMIRKSLEELDFLKGYKLENFDEYFLKECANLLPNLNNITIEEISLSKLKCIVYSKYKTDLILMKVVPIYETPAYKYLQGDKKDFLEYQQFNYFNVDNEKRLLKILKSVKINKYPYKDKYIVLFNDQDIIRDGQHRAAVLAYLYGLDTKIKVLRFHFSNKNHIVNVKKNNFKIVCLWFAKKIYKKLKRYFKKDL
ncbi:MAG TPA: hypothetical protein EYP25_06545 [Anaerolineae bacterium]|nr:hypothetical protein [Anaerolineae bacterium]